MQCTTCTVDVDLAIRDSWCRADRCDEKNDDVVHVNQLRVAEALKSAILLLTSSAWVVIENLDKRLYSYMSDVFSR